VRWGRREDSRSWWEKLENFVSGEGAQVKFEYLKVGFDCQNGRPPPVNNFLKMDQRKK
jgi:hypothetical protein